MTTTYPLHFETGHLFVELDGGKWLIDTGAPNTFGTQAFVINGQRVEPSTSHMGLNAETLSQYVQVPCAGLIGADVLNRFDHLFDVAAKTLTVSTETLSHRGTVTGLEFFIGIPIVTVWIGGRDHRMFFDTGAQLSYLEDDALAGFPAAGNFEDFYPGIGPFRVETHRVGMTVGGIQISLRTGALPGALGTALMMARTTGVISNAVMADSVVGYFPQRKRMVF